MKCSSCQFAKIKPFPTTAGNEASRFSLTIAYIGIKLGIIGHACRNGSMAFHPIYPEAIHVNVNGHIPVL